MKKFISILTALLSLSIALTFTSCGIDDDDIFGPKDTWCTMPVEYKNDKGSVELYVSFFYSDTGIKSNKDGKDTKGLRRDMEEGIPAGLTILVTVGEADAGAASSVIEGLTKGTYILKTFANNSEDKEAGIVGDHAKWTAIYLAKPELRKSENQDKDIPPELVDKTRGTYSPLSAETIKDTFNWKKLLANYLLG